MTLVLLNALPFALAVAALWLSRAMRQKTLGLLYAAILSTLFVILVGYLPTISSDGPLTFSLDWVPALGLRISIYLDGLALLFALVITGIGALVALYASHYFDDAAQAGRFMALLLAFCGAMLGVVLAGNLLTLFIMWELTSITSFLLIGFKGKDPAARAGATQALILTGGGGLALLAGLLLLGTAAGSMELREVLANGDLLRQHSWYGGIVVLILIGAFTKSAQWPVHFWLPGAMAAPTPASAYLHSATMVKAGIYLLARLYPTLGDTSLWEAALLFFGLTTMLVGAVNALSKRDLKALLAYSTVSMLGALVALIGLPHGEGLKALAIGILAHAMYKGALFLIAGTVDHATGTRNVDELAGLRQEMPGLALATGIAALSMAGAPPLFGFVAKELLIKDMLISTLAAGVVTVSAALTVTAALIVFWDVFMRKGRSAHFHHAPTWGLTAGPSILAAGSVIAAFTLDSLIGPLVSAVTGKTAELHLIPPVFDTAFALSLIALAAGFGLFLARNVWLRWQIPARFQIPSGAQIYRFMLGNVEAFGDYLLRSQGGKIRHYLGVILATVIGLIAVGGVLRVTGWQSPRIQFRDAADVLRVVLLLLSLGAMLASIFFKKHLLAALSLGLSGYAVGGLFLLEPAPDVALVQFLVETVGTVLVILILAKTSDPERQTAIDRVWEQRRPGLIRDIALSVAVGLGVSLFALSAVVNRPERATIATWHLENSLPQTGINDVVASIVTDFRGMDTLIEITVFGMASLGVLTVLTRPEPGRIVRPLTNRLRRRKRPDIHTTGIVKAVLPDELEPPEETWREVDTTPTLSTPLIRTAAKIVMPFALLLSITHILYGGGRPGDGFTAGVVSGLAVALSFVVFGFHETNQRLPWLHPPRYIGLGLTLAFANAALPLLFGREFLATTMLKGIALPAGLHLSSTTLFEIAIFLTVLGGVSAVMEAIAHPKEVEQL